MTDYYTNPCFKYTLLPLITDSHFLKHRAAQSGQHSCTCVASEQSCRRACFGRTRTLLTAFLLVHSQVSFLCLCWVCRAIVHLTAWHVGTGSSLPPRLRFGDPSCSEAQESHTYTTSRQWNCTQSWGFTDRYGSSLAKHVRMQPELQRRDVEEESRCHIICVWLRALRPQTRTEAGGGLLSNRGDWVYATLDQRWIAGKSIYNTMQNRRSSTEPFFVWFLCCCTCSMGCVSAAATLRGRRCAWRPAGWRRRSLGLSSVPKCPLGRLVPFQAGGVPLRHFPSLP